MIIQRKRYKQYIINNATNYLKILYNDSECKKGQQDATTRYEIEYINVWREW